MTSYRIGELAALAGVSVRTLRHYDEIGLLVPSGRTSGGYRDYGDADRDRLQQILFYRELDFGLDDIGRMLADPASVVDDHLRRQHRLVRQRLARHNALLGAIEKEMEARAMGISLTPEEQFEIFGTDSAAGDWADEADTRWGDTDAWRQSQRRTATYTKQDWIEITAEADRNVEDFAAALRAGEPADGDVAMDLAEAHRRHISRWFYDCGIDIHRGLAEMYVSDPRFTARYDALEPGLARYVRDAIMANADRQ